MNAQINQILQLVKTKFFKPIKNQIKSILFKTNRYTINTTSDSINLKSSIPVTKPTKKVMMLLWPFIAVGGAENLTLSILKEPRILSKFDYINVCLLEPSDSLGDLSPAFEEISCAFYKAENFQDTRYINAYIEYLLEYYKVDVLFIPNGTTVFYDSVQVIKEKFPSLRIVNQVYDHEEGWIRHYDISKAAAIDFHVAPNLQIREKYMSYQVPSNRAPLIYHGIDLEVYNPDKLLSANLTAIKHKLELPENKIIITFAARIHPQKRPMDFVEIAKQFSPDSRFHFLMVGDGEMAAKVQLEIDSMKISNITKLGFYKPIQDIYLCTDILVVTSEYEGLPLVVLQSSSMGIPIVSTSVGAIPDVIKNNENGFLVNQIGDLDLFNYYIQKLANNLEDFKSRSKSNYIELSHRFSLEKMCESYLEVFEGKL
ncbi:family 2 glycosyl transferase [Calothrix sp. NIES-4101]|nr:family 2 glycosyl transferase [Calothrix sp. NIES-4101]